MSILKREQFITSPVQLSRAIETHAGVVPGRFYVEVCDDGSISDEPVDGHYTQVQGQPDGVVFSSREPGSYPQSIGIREELIARGVVSVMSRHAIPER